MEQTWLQGVTLGIALLGAGLGLLNAWRNWSQDRVKVLVIPTAAVDGGGDWYVSVEVRNLSTFGITVKAVGFTSMDPRRHMQVVAPRFTLGERLPVRLEPRTSCTALMAVGANVHALAHARQAYIDTACGRRFFGSSPALRDVQQLTAAQIAHE